MLIVVISMDNKMSWSPNLQGNKDIPSGTQYCPISFLSLKQYLLFCPELVRWIPFENRQIE